MIVMVWPWGARTPPAVWVTVFTLSTGWFVASAAWSPGRRLGPSFFAVTAVAMVWMGVSMPAQATPGNGQSAMAMPGMSHSPTGYAAWISAGMGLGLVAIAAWWVARGMRLTAPGSACCDEWAELAGAVPRPDECRDGSGAARHGMSAGPFGRRRRHRASLTPTIAGPSAGFSGRSALVVLRRSADRRGRREEVLMAGGGRSAPWIVVGVDGSAASARALRWALDQAESTGGTVEAITAWEVPTSYGAGPTVLVGEDLADAARRALAATVSRMVRGAPGDTRTAARPARSPRDRVGSRGQGCGSSGGG